MSGVDLEQVTKHIIIPNLYEVEKDADVPGFYGMAPVTLMLATGIVESSFMYVKQKEGPALGFWQMEPATASSLVEHYFSYRKIYSDIVEVITGVLPSDYSPQDLIGNANFACLMARFHYYKESFKMPDWKDENGMWEVYKTYYNSHKGATSKDRFLTSYELALNTMQHIGLPKL